MISRSKSKQLKERSQLQDTHVNKRQQTNRSQKATSSATTKTKTNKSTFHSQSTSTFVATPSSPSPPSTVHLQSNDGRIFTVKAEVARLFGIVRTMLEDSIITNGVNEVEEPVPLPNVSGSILELAITWAKHHQEKGLPDQPREESSQDGNSLINSRGGILDQGSYHRQPSLRSMFAVDPWDAAFLGALTPAQLQALLEAANFLNCQQLLDSACKMIAQMIKGALGGPDGSEEVTRLLQIPVNNEKTGQKRSEKILSCPAAGSTAPQIVTDIISQSAIKPSSVKVKREDEREVRFVPLRGPFPKTSLPPEPASPSSDAHLPPVPPPTGN